MLKQALLLATMAFAGCATTDAAPVEHRGISKQAMVNGTVSTTARDSVIFLMNGQDSSCSGTLIAPNLVLTARHCVAEPQGEKECTNYGTTTSPDQMTIKVGVSAGWETGTVVAKGAKIFSPTTDNSCGFDVALIQLDQDVPNAKISPVRFTALQPNEKVTAVGYGVDENENELPQRMERATTILGVGPAKVPYKMKDGTTFNYDAPAGDVVTGESTCEGDSGGPLFDQNGAVVAMTSRGPMDGPMGGVHGKLGCGDMVSIYASTIMNKALILEAAKQAGHPIAEGSVSTQSTADEESADDADDAEEEEEPAPKKKSTTKKKSSSSAAAAQPAGCSSAPGQRGDAWTLVLGVGIALASVRRRRLG